MGYPPSDVLSVATFYTMLHQKARRQVPHRYLQERQLLVEGHHSPASTRLKRRLKVESGEVTAGRKIQLGCDRVPGVLWDGAGHAGRRSVL